MNFTIRLFALLGWIALVQAPLQAQNAPHAEVATLKTAAAKAAAQDASIIRRFSHSTGQTGYYRKSVSPVTGQPTLTPVQYCNKSGRFNRVAAAPCIKLNADCRKKTAAAPGAPSTAANPCSPAQKAACSGANAKMAAALKKHKEKA